MTAGVGGPRRLALWFVGSFVAFLMVRLLPFAYDPLIGTTEQHEFGLFAEHVVLGLLGPPSAYLPEPHQSCAVGFGLLCAPWQWLFGPTMGTLRICALVLHALGAAAVVTAARGMGSPSTGVVAWSLVTVAPPKFVHYGHKGSTNHDDAAWLLALALLPLLSGPWTAPRRVISALIAGLAAAYYLDALAPAVVLIVAVSWSVGRGGWRGTASSFVAFALGVASLLVTGAEPWRSGGIVRAVTGEGASFVGWARLQRGLDAFLAMGEFPQRLHLGTVALPGEGWGGVAYGFALLSLVFLPGPPAAGVPTMEQWQRMALRRVVLAMGIVQVLVVWVVAADPGLPGYLPPAWTWWVLAAAVGAPSRATASWARIRSIVALTVVALAALTPPWQGSWRCLVGLEPSGVSQVLLDQGALTRELRGSRLLRSSLGRSLALRGLPPDWLGLFGDRPHERLDAVRLLGVGAAMRGASMPRVASAVQAEVARGYGCGLAGQDAVPGAVGAHGSVVLEGWAWCRSGGGPDELARYVGELPPGPAREAACVGLAHRAWEGARHDWLMGAMDVPLRCSGAALGRGFALGLLTDAGGRPVEGASIRWWWPSAPDSAAVSFEAELGRAGSPTAADR